MEDGKVGPISPTSPSTGDLDPLAGIDLHRLLERRPIPLDTGPAAEGLQGRCLLITGAGGSIGSALAELLLGFEPEELVLLEHHENSLFDLTQRLPAAHPGAPVRFVLGDVRDRTKLARVFAAHRPQVVFHLAAYKHVPLGEENPDQAVAVNVLATLGVAREAMAAGVEKLVYTSTDKAVNPPSVYGATKRTAELILGALGQEQPGTSFRVVRLVNTLGAQGGVIRTFARQIRAGQPITITDEAMTRYWISMAEAIGFLALAAGRADLEGLLLLDMGQPVRLIEVARRLWGLLRPQEPFQSRCIGMRPGERLHEELSYPHEKLEPILRETYGVIVYQEQVMQVAVQMAGYSMAEADMLRAAIAKSKADVVAEQKHKFVEGAVNSGYEKRFAQDVFSLVEKFGNYGFNKSHATGYALVSYQTAYLKAHYPREFMAALLTSVINTKDKVPFYVNECREMGIEILPPDINKSYSGFTATDEGIRFGLSAVRNVGESAVESIQRVREESGEFRSFQDFCERVEVGILNKRALESLIKSGAFDAMGYSRNHLLKTYDAVADICVAKRRRAQEGQFSLFDGGEKEDIDADLLEGQTFAELPKDRLLSYEKEMLGLYVTDHPLMEVKDRLKRYVECDTVHLKELKDGNIRWVGGIVAKVTKKLTKKGDPMAVVNLEDLVGSVEVVVFPNLYAQHVEVLAEDEIVCVRGRLDVREDEVKMVALEINKPDLQDDSQRPLIVRLSAERCTDDDLIHLKAIIKEHPGPNPVELHLRNGTQTTILKLGDGFRVDPSSHLHGELRAFLGENGIGRR